MFALLCHPFDCSAVDFPDALSNAKHRNTVKELVTSENDNRSSASANVIFIEEERPGHTENKKTDLETAATGNYTPPKTRAPRSSYVVGMFGYARRGHLH